MSVLTPQHIIKYISVAVIVAIILYFVPGEKIEMDHILLVSLGAAVFSFILDVLAGWYARRSVTEGMESVCPELLEEDLAVQPNQYLLDMQEQDQANTGLEYDHNIPGYYLINNGKYSDSRIPYSESDELIEASKLHDLYNQHNFNILSSPHTHIGKNRGRMNWVPVYE